MAGEAVAAALLAVAALWLVLQPLIRPRSPRSLAYEPLDPEETPKGIALAALKEIEFDRETGKLSDTDYEYLKAKYTAAALQALRADREVETNDVEALIATRVRSLRSASTAVAPTSVGTTSAPADSARGPGRSCDACGPRPESDAVFCSSCGRRLASRPACDNCGTGLRPDSRYCERCGRHPSSL